MMKISSRVMLAVSAAWFAMALAGAGRVPLFAQTAKPSLSGQGAQGQQNGAPGQAGADSKPGQAGQAAAKAPAGPVISAEEQKAYAAIQAELSAGLDPDKVISLSQDFDKKFPNSVLLSYVYTFEATGYQQKGDVNKVIEVGEKSLKLNGDNLMSLIVVSTMLPQPQLMQGNELDKQKKLTEAETDANHALDLIGKLPKQPNETDDQLKKRKDNISTEPHAALGMVHLQKATMTLTGGMDPDELAKAAQDFKAAVELADRPASQNYYRLGEIYAHQNKIDDAIAAFSKASELGQGTGIQQYADTQIETLKKRQAQAKPPGAK